jgi:hypothetical protein
MPSEAADADQRGENLAAPVGHEVVDTADALILAVHGRSESSGSYTHVLSFPGPLGGHKTAQNLCCSTNHLALSQIESIPRSSYC